MEDMEPAEPLLLLVRKLKEVFEMCDEDEDGFIRVEHFVQLGMQFGQTDQQIKKLVECLDPNANGRISFKDFCHGVFSIKGCEEMLKNVLHSYQTQNQTFCYQSTSEILGTPLYPLDSDMDSSTAPECSHSHHGNKDEILGGLFILGNSSCQLVPSASASVISAEEQFEDYGEGEDVDFVPSSPCADDDTRTNGFSDLGSSLPSSAGHTPQKIRHLYSSELLDVYCSQCCKKVNLLNDLEARLKNLKANSPNRKISSTAFGRQLFHHSNFSSSHGSTEDLFHDSIDSCDVDITEKVSYLEKKVSELENDSLANGDLKSKLKHENTQLVHRVHELEEQIKDQETRSQQILDEEVKRYRDVYSKMEKDKSNQIEVLSNRLQMMEEENSDMKVNVCRLKSQTDKLDQEKQRMTDKLEDTSLRLKDEMDLYRKMMDKLWQNRHEFQKEREDMQELVDDLRRELDHLQLFKLETENPGQGRNQFSARSREIELEHEVKRLRQENYKLRDQNDDLNGQILSLSLYEAKNLFSCHTKAQSLATEIDNASRDELVDALREQEEINFRLRQYMDKIILAILDHNPSILEIKH